jgi:isoleucyl-tRNA synthetase
VAVSTVITPELADEGLAREVVRRIQDMRREAGFELSDRITTWFSGDADLERVMASQGDYVRSETLSTQLLNADAPADAHAAAVDLEGIAVRLGVRRNA